MSGNITSTEGGGFVASGTDGVRLYDVASMRSALRLEIKTGMILRPGYSLVRACIDRGYVPEGIRRKRDAYAYVEALAVSLGLSPRPLD